MQDFKPFISVVIPVYNGSDYLAEAIDSVLAQTYTHFEIVVVNDGSADDGATERVALGYADRIRYFSKPNGGVASALNHALLHARGEYISWLSHDDLYTPFKLECQVQFLAALAVEQRERAIVYGHCSIFSGDPQDDQYVEAPEVAPQDFRYSLAVRGQLHGCSLLIPKIAFEETGGFNTALRTTQDYDLWFRMASGWHFYNSGAHLVKSRYHAQQGNITLSDIARRECNAMYTGFVQALSLEEVIRGSGAKHAALAYAQLAYSMFYRGFMTSGRMGFLYALKYARFCQPLIAGQAFVLPAIGAAVYCLLVPVRYGMPPAARYALRHQLAKARRAIGR